VRRRPESIYLVPRTKSRSLSLGQISLRPSGWPFSLSQSVGRSGQLATGHNKGERATCAGQVGGLGASFSFTLSSKAAQAQLRPSVRVWLD